MTDSKSKKAENPSLKAENKKPVCGIVRPIATIDGCGEHHWLEVHEILCDAITNAEFEPNLVSHSNESGIIQKTIIENLYFNDIVVCDISAKNPNVMLELGMRLAFDKPTIVVKDDATAFSFDISTMEHVIYRRDLRFGDIVEFKRKLTDKIIATHSRHKEDPNYSSFLGSFGEFKVAKVEQKQVSSDELLDDKLNQVINQLSRLNASKTSNDAWNGLGLKTAPPPRKIIGVEITARPPESNTDQQLNEALTSITACHDGIEPTLEVSPEGVRVRIRLPNKVQIEPIVNTLSRFKFDEIRVNRLHLDEVI